MNVAEQPFVPRPRTSLGARSIAAILFGLFVLQAALAARDDSVTVDEFVHVPIGLYMLRTHDLTPDPINPPLSRMILALPLWPDATIPTPALSSNHWGMGLAFMDQNAEHYHTIFVRSRCVVILLCVLLGMLLYHWSYALDGPASAVVVAALSAFSPSFLAHGHLATVDAAAALGFALTIYGWWRYLDRGSFAGLVIAGIAGAIAILLKFSAAVALLVIAVTSLTEILSAERGRRFRVAGWLLVANALVLATLVATLDAFYLFQGLNEPLGSLKLPGGGIVARLGELFPELSLPLPSPFLAGFDLATTGRDSERAPFYFAGVFSTSGWWYYHLAAFALKTPVPVVLASILILAAGVLGRLRGGARHCLVTGAVAVFVVNGALNPLNTGVRHVLAAEPLLLVLIAPLFASSIPAPQWGKRRFVDWVAAIVGILAVAWSVASTARVSPRYLEYFNEAAGGPAMGRQWLLDSNLDWGQDLVRLSHWMEKQGLASVPLAYAGTVHPLVYGVHFTPLTQETRGLAVISASTLMGSTYATWLDERRHESPATDAFAWLRGREPVEQIGSMLVFDLR